MGGGRGVAERQGYIILRISIHSFIVTYSSKRLSRSVRERTHHSGLLTMVIPIKAGVHPKFAAKFKFLFCSDFATLGI